MAPEATNVVWPNTKANMSSLTAKETGDHPVHLEPSELGTKEYWESFYEDSLTYLTSKQKPGQDQREEDEGEGEDQEDEVDNEEDDEEEDEKDDPGTSWFSEYNAPEKVLRFLTSASFPLAPCNTNRTSSSSDEPSSVSRSSSSAHDHQPSVLDLGTGNGSMLTLLRDQGGFTGPMVGVDYSPKSIELARHLVSRSLSSSSPENIRFEVWDILAAQALDMPDWFPAEKGGFDIVLDKGTFDAVSLSAEEIEDEGEMEGGATVKWSRRVQRRICERYPPAAIQLVRPGGFLVVTSCNWTEDELVKWFTTSATGTPGLVVWDRIAYTKFRFGGQEGQGVCTVCFQRPKGGEGKKEKK